MLQVMVRAGGSSNRTSGSVLQRANFDEETTRRLEAFRVGGADAKRPWYLLVGLACIHV